MENKDLEMLLASCVHDMKNSLSLILNSVDHLGFDEEKDEKKRDHIANLRFEASRLNNDLMHLLGVYRLKEQELPLVIDEHEVWETLQHQVLKNELLLKKYNVELTIDCDEDEIWYYDQELIGGVINNILVNTVRYTKSKILIKAFPVNGMLCIEISDDGEGYPENMLLHPDTPNDGLNFRSGSTSLGIYFAAKIARMHKRGENKGHITLSNGGQLGGGIFSIYIP
jgi:K+-sensing histidine kinase KdpD